MKKKLAMLAATAAMAVAGPASADDLDDELLFRGYPVYGAVVVDDVDYDNAGERSRLDGECFVEDVDLDDLVAEQELTCYY